MWRFEIAPIERKLRLGKDASRCTLFKATRIEALSLQLRKTFTWPGSRRRRSPGAPHRALGAGRRAERGTRISRMVGDIAAQLHTQPLRGLRAERQVRGSAPGTE